VDTTAESTYGRSASRR